MYLEAGFGSFVWIGGFFCLRKPRKKNRKEKGKGKKGKGRLGDQAWWKTSTPGTWEAEKGIAKLPLC